jgi:hypothetical protein
MSNLRKARYLCELVFLETDEKRANMQNIQRFFGNYLALPHKFPWPACAKYDPGLSYISNLTIASHFAN